MLFRTRTVTTLPDGRLQAVLELLDGRVITFVLDPKNLVIYAVANQKGGVGKTPTSINLAYALVRVIRAIFGIEIKVLLVDMDPQASLSEYFLGDQADVQEITILDALCGGPVEGPHGKPQPIAPIIINDNIHLLPAHDGLAAAEIIIPRLSNTEKRLAKVLSYYAGTYAVAVIDCPPSLGILNKNALATAHKVVIPVKTERSAERTLKLIRRSIDDVVESDLNGGLQTWGILPTLFDSRKGHHRKVLSEIHQNYPGQTYPEVSAETTKYNEAFERRTDVSSLDKNLGQYWDRLALSMLIKEEKKTPSGEKENDEQWMKASNQLLTSLQAQPLPQENVEVTTQH